MRQHLEEALEIIFRRRQTIQGRPDYDRLTGDQFARLHLLGYDLYSDGCVYCGMCGMCVTCGFCECADSDRARARTQPPA